MIPFKFKTIELILTGCIFFLTAICHAEVYESFLEPNVSIEIESPFRGILDKLHVKEGDAVQKGQLVAELKKGVLEASLKIAKASMEFQGKVNSAKEQLQLNKTRFENLLNLAKTGNVRQKELERAKTDVAIAQASLLMALEEKEIRKLEYKKILAQISENKIRSPIDGVISKINKQEAELVGNIDAEPFMIIVQLNPLKVTFHLLPQVATKLEIGKKIALNIVEDAANIEGDIDFVAPVINPESGTVAVKILVANKDGILQSGKRCELSLD